MRIHYFQHVSYEGLGYIAKWLIENKHQVSSTRFYEIGYEIPSLGDIDALIIMGGPMGVHDDETFPWLKQEKEFIRRCLGEKKKVFGVCLGAQLIAVCLGVGVHRATFNEIGWYKVYPTEECKRLLWFYNLFKDHPTVFHWHGDLFEIPSDRAIHLLNSEANINQAFIYDDTVVALQFHLEVGRPNVLQMIESCSLDLNNEKFIQSIDNILKGAEHSSQCETIIGKLLDHFIGSSNVNYE
ncbi:type 1 glutamine amidotransferase [Parapedobacter tibetensis]|uniref:type 1 glutamine amidotransferase n=1 Tax=Parapedobacter tibetensis TaxID=2972951 RepID=UPI00214DA477|nr:type 1 glutamine amidotransferase [Parapedobacter tibetensis]